MRPASMERRTGREEWLEFLPAALEIQETPPLPAARWLVRIILLFFVAAAAWAWIGKVDIVATAPGRTIPAGRVKIIQPLETAVISRIRVSEGQRVGRGQVLIEFDPTRAEADRARLRSEALALQAERARLAVLLDAAQADTPPPDLEAALSARLPVGLERRLAAVTMQRAASAWAAYQAELLALDGEIAARRAEWESVREHVVQLEATNPLIAERAASAARLLARQFGSRMQWLELEQQRIEGVKARDMQLRRLDALDAAATGLAQQKAAREAAFQEKLAAALGEAGRQLAALDLELRKADELVNRHALAAPVSGTVQRLAVHTVGGVVTPAQELMQVVPETDLLEVEAWILNRDIGYVQSGQAAAVKVETYPFTRFGTIAGTVRDVARDAVPDERLGPVYPARIRLARRSMTVDGVQVPLVPGMAVTVELKLGARRIVEFLLSPMLRYREESMRER